ncbi:MAG: IclR family transcriptional regulator [Pseudomonadota bacterium]
MTEDNKRTYKAPALEKGLEILEILAAERRPMSMSAIATSLGRSKNEIFRMLSVLEQKGYLERREGSEQFHITNHLFDLGMQVPPVSTLLEAALPKMRRLAERLGQSCHLAVPSSDQMVVIARVESPGAIGFSVRVGYRRSLADSGSGKVLLAWMSPERRGPLMEYFAERLGPAFNPEVWEYELKAFRARGHVEVQSTATVGIIDVGAPILQGEDGEILASLTIPYLGGPSTPYGVRDTVPFLTETAAEISRLAGAHGGF